MKWVAEIELGHVSPGIHATATHFNHLVATRNHFPHRLFRIDVGVALVHITHLHGRADSKITRIRLIQSHDQAEQGRLTRSVGTDHANDTRRGQFEVEVFIKQFVPKGFGNALLEAFYFRVPVVINRYSIFIQDIEPKGFLLPMMDGFVTAKLLQQIERILDDHVFRTKIVESNYQLATQFYGYIPLRRNLQTLIASLPGLA